MSGQIVAKLPASLVIRHNYRRFKQVLLIGKSVALIG